MANSDFGRFAIGRSGGGPFDPAALLDLAQAECGTDVSLDKLGAEGLTRLCADLTDQAENLSFMGKKLLQRALVETLLKRVYTDRTLAARGPMADGPAPIFIVAPFRSGTTFLHRLMAQDPQFQVTATWQVSVAISDPNQPDAAIRAVATYLDRICQIAPDLQRLHPTGATLPEECFGLLEPSFLSPSFLFWATLPTYQRWLDSRSSEDWSFAYQQYAKGILASGTSSTRQRPLLKSPFHLWGLSAIVDVFPQARIVQLHRDPAKVMRSTTALLAANRAVYARTGDAGAQDNASSLMATALNRANMARAHADKARFIDLGFDALIKDPLEAVRCLYAKLDLTLSDQASANMSAWLNARPATIKNHNNDRWQHSIPEAFIAYTNKRPSQTD